MKKPDFNNIEFKSRAELEELIIFAKNEIKEYKKFIRIINNWREKRKEINEKK